MKDVIFLLIDSIKYAPHSAREVDLVVSSSEALRTVDTGIMFEVLAIFNATPERIKVALDRVIPYNFRLSVNGSAYIDGVTFCEVIVEHWGGTLT